MFSRCPWFLLFYFYELSISLRSFFSSKKWTFRCITLRLRLFYQHRNWISNFPSCLNFKRLVSNLSRLNAPIEAITSDWKIQFETFDWSTFPVGFWSNNFFIWKLCPTFGWCPTTASDLHIRSKLFNNNLGTFFRSYRESRCAGRSLQVRSVEFQPAWLTVAFEHRTLSSNLKRVSLFHRTIAIYHRNHRLSQKCWVKIH